MGGWTGLLMPNLIQLILLKCQNIGCKKECEDDPECNNIRWTTKDNTCTLMRSAPEKNTDGRWAFSNSGKNFRWY